MHGKTFGKSFMKKSKKSETAHKHEKGSAARASVIGPTKPGRWLAGSSSRGKWMIGIDEVGRGPLAGPVTVGAVSFFVDMNDARGYTELRNKLMEISGKEYPVGVDSKKMKESDRDFWYEIVLKLARSCDLHAVTSSASASMIDKKGIAVCIKELVDVNLKKLSRKFKIAGSLGETSDSMHDSLSQMQVLLDGGLKTALSVDSQKTIIKGDEKELLISLASVYAKVTRDNHMRKLSKNPKYSAYGFDMHKGYGTLKHRRAMKKHGLSDEHRKSFCKKF
jgi:ribonuclease HII